MLGLWSQWSSCPNFVLEKDFSSSCKVVNTFYFYLFFVKKNNFHLIIFFYNLITNFMYPWWLLIKNKSSFLFLQKNSIMTSCMSFSGSLQNVEHRLSPKPYTFFKEWNPELKLVIIVTFLLCCVFSFSMKFYQKIPLPSVYQIDLILFIFQFEVLFSWKLIIKF